jgi:hypothetical protein
MTNRDQSYALSLFFPEKEPSSRNVPAFSILDLKAAQFVLQPPDRTEQRQQVPILGGPDNRNGRKWDIGFLDLQTQLFDPSDTSQSSLPSENFGIAVTPAGDQ